MRGILKLLFGITIGAVYGLLFAQRPGKKLRADLAKSENPLKTLFDEGVKMDLEARDTLVDWAKNSQELQQVMASGKDQFNALVDGAKDMSEEARAQAQKKMEEMAKNASKAAEDLKKAARKKAKSVKKSAVKKASSVKKTATKKANAARKTATKAVKRVTKK